MAKILITFLGNVKRNYEETIYKVNGVVQEATTSISKALYDGYKIDKIIVIGTMGSLWEEYYNVFSPEDSDFQIKLMAMREQGADPNSPISSELLDEISVKLPYIKAVAIPYGINDEQLEVMALTFLGLKSEFKKSDHIYLDITHSFRSLPLFAFQLLTYLHTVKGVHIEAVLYGNLGAKDPLTGVTPVVSMRALLNTSHWITAAKQMVDSGNANAIADLLQEENANLSDQLRRLTKAIKFNFIPEIRSSLAAVLKHTESNPKSKANTNPFASLVLPDILASLKDTTHQKYGIDFLLGMAQWNIDHLNFSNAVLMIEEGIMEAFSLKEKTPNSKGISTKFNQKKKKYTELYKIHMDISKIRNDIAHSKDQGNRISIDKVLDTTKNALKDLNTYSKKIK